MSTAAEDSPAVALNAEREAADEFKDLHIDRPRLPYELIEKILQHLGLEDAFASRIFAVSKRLLSLIGKLHWESLDMEPSGTALEYLSGYESRISTILGALDVLKSINEPAVSGIKRVRLAIPIIERELPGHVDQKAPRRTPTLSYLLIRKLIKIFRELPVQEIDFHPFIMQNVALEEPWPEGAVPAFRFTPQFAKELDEILSEYVDKHNLESYPVVRFHGLLARALQSSTGDTMLFSRGSARGRALQPAIDGPMILYRGPWRPEWELAEAASTSNKKGLLDVDADPERACARLEIPQKADVVPVIERSPAAADGGEPGNPIDTASGVVESLPGTPEAAPDPTPGEGGGEVRCEPLIEPEALSEELGKSIDFEFEFNRVEVEELKIEDESAAGRYGVVYKLVMGEGAPEVMCDAFLALSKLPSVHQQIERRMRAAVEDAARRSGLKVEDVALLGCAKGSVIIMLRLFLFNKNEAHALKTIIETSLRDGSLAKFFETRVETSIGVSKDSRALAKQGLQKSFLDVRSDKVDVQKYDIYRKNVRNLHDVGKTVESASGTDASSSSVAPVGSRRPRDESAAAGPDESAGAARPEKHIKGLDTQYIINIDRARPARLSSLGDFQSFYTFEELDGNSLSGKHRISRNAGEDVHEHITSKLGWAPAASTSPDAAAPKSTPMRAVLLPFEGGSSNRKKLSECWSTIFDGDSSERPVFVGPDHFEHTVDSIETAKQTVADQIVARAGKNFSYGVFFMELKASFALESYLEHLHGELDQLRTDLQKERSRDRAAAKKGELPGQLKAGQRDAKFRRQFQVDKHYTFLDVDKWDTHDPVSRTCILEDGGNWVELAPPTEPDPTIPSERIFRHRENICVLYQGPGPRNKYTMLHQTYFCGGPGVGGVFKARGIMHKVLPGSASGTSKKPLPDAIVLILLKNAEQRNPNAGSAEDDEETIRLMPRRALFVNEFTTIPAEELLDEKTSIWAFTKEHYEARIKVEDPESENAASRSSKDGIQFGIETEGGSLATQWGAVERKLAEKQKTEPESWLELVGGPTKEGARKSTRAKQAPRRLVQEPAQPRGGGGTGTAKASGGQHGDFDDAYWKRVGFNDEVIKEAGGRTEDAQAVLSAVYRTIQDPSTYDQLKIDDLGDKSKVLFAKKAIKRLMDPGTKYCRGVHARGSKGILLYGPPGVGKTEIARAIASECKATFFLVSRGTILSKWTGVAEATAKTMFCAARNMAPSIVFFDELDSMAAEREQGSNDAAVLNEILQQMDGFVKRNQNQILVLAGTNNKDFLDRAMLDRFSRHIELGYPTEKDVERVVRVDMAEVASGDYAYVWDCSDAEIKSFAEDLARDQVSYRTVNSIIEKAADLCEEEEEEEEEEAAKTAAVGMAADPPGGSPSSGGAPPAGATAGGGAERMEVDPPGGSPPSAGGAPPDGATAGGGADASNGGGAPPERAAPKLRARHLAEALRLFRESKKEDEKSRKKGLAWASVGSEQGALSKKVIGSEAAFVEFNRAMKGVVKRLEQMNIGDQQNIRTLEAMERRMDAEARLRDAQLRSVENKILSMHTLFETLGAGTIISTITSAAEEWISRGRQAAGRTGGGAAAFLSHRPELPPARNVVELKGEAEGDAGERRGPAGTGAPTRTPPKGRSSHE
eukprot:tig00000042_g15670.t1